MENLRENFSQKRNVKNSHTYIRNRKSIGLMAQAKWKKNVVFVHFLKTKYINEFFFVSCVFPRM